LNKLICLAFISVLFSCGEKHSAIAVQEEYKSVDKSAVVLIADKGLVYFEDKLFTGETTRYNQTGDLLESVEYLSGKKSGLYKKWYDDGLLSFQAAYIKGRRHGTSSSWWNNGNLRSESNYINGIVGGIQTQWYISGVIFKQRNIVNGKEEGLQQAWRENGKLFANYEVIDGRMYGLKRSKLCFELEDEEYNYD
jgi:antitoxin component YwqK of YwqJK toxin-antitoxin module